MRSVMILTALIFIIMTLSSKAQLVSDDGEEDSVHLHFHLKSGDDMESESEPTDPIPTTTLGSISTSGTPTTLLPVQPGKIEGMNRRGRYGRYGYGIGRYGSRRGNGGYGNGRARYG